MDGVRQRDPGGDGVSIRIPQTQAKVHGFRERLQWSEDASDEPFWDAIYEKAFPNMVWHQACTGNTEGQHRGVDRLVYFANDKVLRIDEKKRQAVYDDILLEYLSVDTTGAPGWIEKDLAIDYLAYAFMPTQRVYLFDWPMLRRAWQHYGEGWKAEYPHIEAQNNGYKTHGVAVPIPVLRDAVSLARIIQL